MKLLNNIIFHAIHSIQQLLVDPFPIRISIANGSTLFRLNYFLKYLIRKSFRIHPSFARLMHGMIQVKILSQKLHAE